MQEKATLKNPGRSPKSARIEKKKDALLGPGGRTINKETHSRSWGPRGKMCENRRVSVMEMGKEVIAKI